MASEIQRYDVYLRHGELHRVDSENGCSVKWTDHSAKVRELDAAVEVLARAARRGNDLSVYAASSRVDNTEEFVEGIMEECCDVQRLFDEANTNPIAAAAIQKARNEAGLGKGGT